MGMDKSFWMVCVTHMFLEVFYLTQVSLIPVFITDFNLSIIEASVVVTVPNLVRLSMNFPAGIFTRRFNTKYLLSASMLIQGASALFLSQTDNFWTLVLGAALMRASSPLYHISGLSQISTHVEKDQISRSMGFHNALGSFGSAIGTISLAIFLSTLGWRWIYLFWSIPILAWGFILLRFSQFKSVTVEEREPKQFRSSGYSHIYTSTFLFFLVSLGLRSIGVIGIETFMTTYLVTIRGISKSIASLVFGLGPVVGILGALTGGYLGDRMGAKRALNLAIIGSLFSIFLLALSPHVYLLTTIYIVYSFFSNSVWTPINTIVAEMVPMAERGVGYSAYLFTEGLMMIITPIIAATFIQLFNVWHIFPFSIIFIVISLVVLQRLP